MEIESHSLADTKKMAKILMDRLEGGDVLCFYGELGAGKTTLIKSLLMMLGVKASIKSPTFAIMNTYPLSNKRSPIKNLVHIDTYRLKDEQEIIDIGMLDYLGKADSICFVEWPEKIIKLLPRDKITKIKMKHAGENQRLIEIPDK